MKEALLYKLEEVIDDADIRLKFDFEFAEFCKEAIKLIEAKLEKRNNDPCKGCNEIDCDGCIYIS